MNVKNEGMLFALCFGAALLCSRPGRALCLQTVKRLTTDRQLLAALVVALMPTALWTIEKNLWGLKSELTGDSVAAGGRLMSRLLDGSTPQFVFRYLIVEAPAVWIPLLLAVATVMFLRWRNVKPHAGAVLAITTAALYFVGIYAAYLSTPISLEFHLGTSATRTMAGLRMALMIALYFMFDDLERVPASARRRDVALAQ
jgi:hypothetical protein